MKTPQILINGIKLHRGPGRLPTGNFQHTLHFAAEMAQRDDIAVQVLTDEDSHAPMAERIPERMLIKTGFRGDSVLRADWTIVREIRRIRPGIYHRPTGQLPWGLPRVLAVATIADLNFTVLPTPKVKWFYKQASYRWTLHRADWITCVSRFTHDDLVRRLGANPARMSVTRLGANSFPPADEQLAREVDCPYWLTFGHERHKNVEFCLRAILHSPLRTALVVVGATPYIEDTLKPLARDLGIQKRVWFCGKVSPAALHGLYRRAIGLLFVSRYEGFGMPLLEAMSLGCPVICSNCCSIPEVAGDAAVVVEPDDLEGLVAAMQRIYREPVHRDELVGRGHRRAAQFTWAKTAEQTVEVYNKLWRGRNIKPQPR